MTVTVGPGRRVDPFSGWTVAGAAFAVLFVAYGLQFSFGVLLPVLVDEMGWSRSQLTLAYGMYIFAYSALSGVTGTLTDRVGPRAVIGVGGLMLGLGWMALSRSTSLLHVHLTLAFTALGMSATWVPANATVVRWFTRRRGLAVGISSSGGSLGNFVVPPLASVLTTAFGWRTALLSLGAVGAVALVACAAVMIRDPESVGQLPDGDSPGEAAVDDSAVQDQGVPPDVARRDPAYWLIMAVFGLTWMVVFVPFVHLVAYAEELGISSLSASLLISAIGVGGATGRLTVGSVSDRFGRPAVLKATLTAQITAFVGLSVSTSLPTLMLSATVFGFAYGGGVATFPALIGDVFGRAHSGAIVGRIFSVAGATAAVGPYLAALAYDSTGSYQVAFLSSAGVNVVSLLLASRLTLRPVVGAV